MTDFPWSNADTFKRLETLRTRLRENEPDVENVFTQTFLKDATKQTKMATSTPLAGALVSVKDLFDVEGYVTRAGTTFMKEDEPASEDATVVAKLRAAGTVLVGHTNMTELAYSGLGLNPHYGTPSNALVSGAIPGGSTSGGAISVAAGLTDIAIGTDTGGSLRIPAAFNGIVGFKPTQATVSRHGCKALSRSLDSVGPMAKTVAECRVAYDGMRSEKAIEMPLTPEFIIPDNFGFDDIEPEIQHAFDSAVEQLRAAGYKVSYQVLDVLEKYKTLPVWHFSAVECRAEYEARFHIHHSKIDPRVSSRMGRADDISPIEYRQTLNLRTELMTQFEVELKSQVLLLPTVPIAPPMFSAVSNDDDFGRLNLLALRNPSLANVMNGCSISLPIGSNTAPAGLMLTTGAFRDDELLNLAEGVESALKSHAI